MFASLASNHELISLQDHNICFFLFLCARYLQKHIVQNGQLVH